MSTMKGRPEGDGSAGRATARARSMAGTEWRVTWRRVAWSAATGSNSRVFQDQDRAERFADQLGRPWHDRRSPWRELSPAVVTVEHRPVGAWVEGWDR